MYLKVTYEEDFDTLLMHLRAKYGHALFDLDGIGKQTDMNLFSKEFFSRDATTTADVSVDANANVDSRDIIAYNFELPKPFFRLNSYYMLWKKLRDIYGIQDANKIVEMQLSGDIYINDFNDITKPYCFNYATYDIMLSGLPMVTKISSIPPKYLYSFKSQLEQFLVIASNSTLGATGLADIFIVMAYYVKNILDTKSDAGFKFKDEKACWKYVEENLVSFIYTINQPSRANQSPFTNVSVFDKHFLQRLCSDYKFPQNDTHPDIEVVQKIQELYLDIMNKELERTPVTFPVTTACFSVDDKGKLLDPEFAKMIAKKNQRFGFINLYCGKTSTLSSCCRLRSETKNEYFNSFGAGSTKIGSLGVVTMNLPRLAMKNQFHKDNFFAELRELVITVAKINNAKRHIIKSRIENDILPLYKFGFMDLKKQYSTCGVNGLNEAVEIFGYSILDPEGQQFALKCLSVINTTNELMEQNYQAPHNCEQVPGENSAIKLSKKDKMVGYNSQYDFYSNQFIPLTINADLADRIKLQGLFDRHFSGGAIAHLNVETRLDDWETIYKLITVCAKMGVVYSAINYNLQRCLNGHMSVGKKELCDCGAAITDNFTRVVGFLTNVKNWAVVRREQDYPNRQFYSVTDTMTRNKTGKVTSIKKEDVTQDENTINAVVS